MNPLPEAPMTETTKSLSEQDRALLIEVLGEPIWSRDFECVLLTNEQLTRLFDATRAEAADRLAGVEAENEALTKALTGLTCGGSEFFIRKGDRYTADIDACVAWVRRAQEDAHRRTVDEIKKRKAVEAEAMRMLGPFSRMGQLIEQFVQFQKTAGRKTPTIKEWGEHMLAAHAFVQAREAKPPGGHS